MTKQERLDQWNAQMAEGCIQPRMWTADDCAHAWEFLEERKIFGVMKRREGCVLCGATRQIRLRWDGSIPHEGWGSVHVKGE